MPNSKGNPVSGGAKYTEGGNILRFSTEITVYLVNDTGYKFIGGGSIRVGFDDLELPLTQVSRSLYLQMKCKVTIEH